MSDQISEVPKTAPVPPKTIPQLEEERRESLDRFGREIQSAVKRREANKLSRRSFLKKAGAVTAGLALGSEAVSETINIASGKPSWITGLWNRLIQQREKRLDNTPKTAVLSADSSPAQAPAAEPKPDYETLNLIFKKRPESNERKALELKYVRGAKTLEQIDAGMDNVNYWILRAALLEKRYQLRLEGRYGLRQPTKAELAFAQRHKIHPESVIDATDAVSIAAQMLDTLMSQKGRNKFFEIAKSDLLREVRNGKLPQEVLDNLEIEEMLPNPGVMIGLLWNETRAMFQGRQEDLPEGIKLQTGVWYLGANIGNKPVLEAIKGDDAEDVRNGLQKLFDALNKKNKEKGIPLQYELKNLGASDKTGDTGIAQLRGNTAWILYQFLKENFNFSFHPNGLKAITAACFYLAWGQAWQDQKDGKMYSKYGFISEKLKKIPLTNAVINKLKAIQKDAAGSWNLNLAESLLEWGNFYQTEIIDKGDYPEIVQLSQRKTA